MKPDLIPFSRKNCGRFFKLRCFPTIDALWERLAQSVTGDAILLGGEPVIRFCLTIAPREGPRPGDRERAGQSAGPVPRPVADHPILAARASDAAMIRSCGYTTIRLDDFISDGGAVPFGIFHIDALNESAETIDPVSLSYVREILVVAWGAERKELARQFLKEPDSLPAGRLLANNAKVRVWLDAEAYPFGEARNPNSEIRNI